MNRHIEEVTAELRRQIEQQDARTERECAKCLENMAHVLLPSVDVVSIYVTQEQRISAGSVDMIVIADVRRLGNDMRREAFVWELKAPQLYLFEIETQDRAAPTKDLLEAENQLLHYHDDVAKSGHLRERWGILSSDHVNFGGIIIGREGTFVKSRGTDDSPSIQLARQTWEIRERTFYMSHRIVLWTWDKVLAIAESPIVAHESKSGDRAATVNLRGTASSTSTLQASLTVSRGAAPASD